MRSISPPLLDHRRENFIARAACRSGRISASAGSPAVPPAGETRFVTNEMVFHVGPNVTREAVESVARRLNLSIVASESMTLTGGTMFTSASPAARRWPMRCARWKRRFGLAQPNYVYNARRLPPKAEISAADNRRRRPSREDRRRRQKATRRDGTGCAAGGRRSEPVRREQAAAWRGAPGRDRQQRAGGGDRSEIDSGHPELADAIAEQFDAVGQPDKPHTHGTGMAGAIVAQRRLMGVAPGARTLAIHAFTRTQQSPQATTKHILAGLEWALNKGARVINMSFAGPYDPMLRSR